MPFNRPTLPQLRERIAANVDLHSDGNPYLARTLEFALTNAVSGACHELYGAIQFYKDQLFDDTAQDEFIERRAAPFGITRIPAVAAQGDIHLTGNNGVTLNAGTELQSPDGQRYTTDVPVIISSGVATVAVTAAEPGAAGNQSAGVTLTFTSPIAGIDSTATVAAGALNNGADQETTERLKTRFAERKQKPPLGGAPSDYIAWAKQAHVDVTRVWVIQHQNPTGATEYGSVLLYVVTDDLPSVIPAQTLLDTISTYIHQHHIRPAGVKNVYIAAPTAKYLDLTFSNLNPNTTAVQQAIQAELQDLLKRAAEPGSTIPLSHIRQAISIATGEYDHMLDSPSADFTTATNEIAVPGTLTWPGA